MKSIKMFKLTILLFFASSTYVCAYNCEDFKTCSQCIGNNLTCAWCIDVPHDGHRCRKYNEIENGNYCKKFEMPLLKPRLKPDQNTSEGQLQPSLTIEASPGQNISFKITFTPAKKYPIDIYYLFDNSYTMSKYRDMITDQARLIYIALKKDSDNVRFGAGSFNEKPGLPFMSLKKKTIPPDTFINHLSLTDNIDLFGKFVRKVENTSNWDDPEAGLDALMQVMACDQINWRSDARRMIIYSTDETYHSAGDGKAAGAYKPHDMKCHLEEHNSQHYYPESASLNLDYPSVGQISNKASESDIYIIFAVVNNPEYLELQKAVYFSQYVQLILSSDSNSLVGMITEQYKALTRSLVLKSTVAETDNHLHLTLNPKCAKADECIIGFEKTPIDIKGSVYVESCPKSVQDGGWSTSKIAIDVDGFRDSVSITVKVKCQCDCETKNTQMSNVECSGVGSWKCGICYCKPGRYGKKCECETEDDPTKCKATNSTTESCSNRGNCRCGKCECERGFGGKYCQIKTDNCNVEHGKVCGGHGVCENDKCKCDADYSGETCSCPLKDDTCIGANGQACTNHGYCECGRCKCTTTGRYGDYCQLCNDCSEERCSQLKQYVLCNYDGNKVGNKLECDKEHKITTYTTVEMISRTDLDALPLGHYCNITLPDKSVIVYKYLDGNNSTKIWIQKEKELPPVPNIWVPIASALGGVLLIGIVTAIVWKCCLDIHDAREYKKFLEQSSSVGYIAENPLYREPEVTIKNPAYRIS